ncbi:MAG: endonuclease III, partial [Hyphomicrobiaceae bacterium]
MKASARAKVKRSGPARLRPDDVEAMFATFQRATPEPKGELESVNDFTLLVAVVLSAQATDA